VFKSKAAGHLKLVANEDEHDVDLSLMKMANKIVAKSKCLKIDQNTYDIRLYLHDVIINNSSTFFSLISMIGQQYKNHLTEYQSWEGCKQTTSVVTD